MIIRSISATNFRNLDNIQIELSEHTNIFYGDNGAGKTNLLEALFVLALGRSHQGTSDSLLIKDNAEVYRLEGNVFDGEREIEVAVAYQKGKRKKITIDQVAIKIAELYEQFFAVATGPEDSEILAGSPSVRRNFIDVYLSQSSRRYLSHLADYQRILQQKNAALRAEVDPDPYNELLIETGSQITYSRFKFLKNLATPAAEHYSALSGGGEMCMTYQPSATSLDECDTIETIKEAFRTKLALHDSQERITRTSVVGPHRDDINFTIRGYPARSHASRGEWRTGAISLKLAVYHLLREQKGTEPVLLLDEVFAELDEKRSAALINSFGKFGQVFLTTAITPPDQLLRNSRSFTIVDGQVIGAD